MITIPPQVFTAGSALMRAFSPSRRKAQPPSPPFIHSLALVLLTALPVSGTTGTIYYNSYGVPPAKTVRAISVDGTNGREISLPVPSPAIPVVSRDGRWLLVSSGGPLASVMLSQNVFRTDLVTGVTTQATRFMDTYSDGITTYENHQGEPDFDTYSYYTTHLPNYKAFSPTGDRVATLDLAAVSGKEPGGIRLAAIQSPVLEVYPVPQTTPVATWLAGGGERTGVNQGGDGLDWHPSREELVGAFRSNIPLTSNIGGGQTEGTVLRVYASSGTSPFLRALTTPTARAYYDFNAFYILNETEQDHAPSISQDGGKVAYVRNTLASDSRVAGGAIRLARCAIRIIDYEGTGDRELVAFGDNYWITKVAWSPDGTEIAFDIAPRLISNGLELQMGNMAQSEIYIVRVSDAALRQLVAAPAAHPTWSPLGFTSVPAELPGVVVTRAGNVIELQLSNLTIGRQFDIEISTDLEHWTVDRTITAATATEALSFPWSPTVPAGFFRVRPR
jgi:hypothetical protein